MTTRLEHLRASDSRQTLHLVASATVTAARRTISGTVVRFGVHGQTSAGRLRVRPGALRLPSDLGRVKLTREHDRAQSRGHLATWAVDGDRVTASFRVSDGPDGDAALAEASDRTRDGLSVDLVDVLIEGDEVIDALVVAVGQVGIPAYDDGRVEQVAASQTHPGNHNQGAPMTPAQRARLEELRALDSRTPEQEAEMAILAALEATPVEASAQPAPQPATQPAAANAPPAPAPAAPAPAVVQASAVPVVPAGVPTPGQTGATTQPRGVAQVVREVTASLQPGGGGLVTLQAALADIVHSAHTENIEQPAWIGELWSGLAYEPEFIPLLNSAALTNWSGIGWRFTSKLEIQDYAGNKAEIPTDNVTTEPAGYEAARMAVGVDIDRKFFDFPNEGFVQSLFEQVRESWTIKLDGKCRVFIRDNATAVTGVDPQPTLLKAAARAMLALKRRRVGRGTFVVVNEEDFFTLFDYAEKDVPVFLDLWNIDPKNFVSTPDVAPGTVLAGVKQTATVRTLPGSPVRVEAQNLTRGGIDEAFFGYYAFEKHHTQGIARTTFTAPVEDTTP